MGRCRGIGAGDAGNLSIFSPFVKVGTLGQSHLQDRDPHSVIDVIVMNRSKPFVMLAWHTIDGRSRTVGPRLRKDVAG